MKQKMEMIFSVTIKDCEVQAFCAGGPGGQHQNKTASAIRVIHRLSGAVGESREMKSQHANKQRAFRRMAESDKFQRWAKIEAARRAGEPSLESKVRQMMTQGCIRVDIHDERGRWIKSVDLLPTEQEINALFE